MGNKNKTQTKELTVLNETGVWGEGKQRGWNHLERS